MSEKTGTCDFVFSPGPPPYDASHDQPEAPSASMGAVVNETEQVTNAIQDTICDVYSASLKHMAGVNPDDRRRYAYNAARRVVYVLQDMNKMMKRLGRHDETSDIPAVVAQTLVETYSQWLAYRQAHPRKQVTAADRVVFFMLHDKAHEHLTDYAGDSPFPVLARKRQLVIDKPSVTLSLSSAILTLWQSMALEYPEVLTAWVEHHKTLLPKYVQSCTASGGNGMAAAKRYVEYATSVLKMLDAGDKPRQKVKHKGSSLELAGFNGPFTKKKHPDLKIN